MTAPRRRLRARGAEYELGARPWVMGIVNATPDSFSDSEQESTPEARARRVDELVALGVDVIDVGGESGVTNRPAVDVAEEVERVTWLVARARGSVLVSIDTYKPEVARAAIAAGASIVNDVSGLRDPDLAGVCAEAGVALVIMHTRAAPKQRLQDPHLYDDVVSDVITFLSERIEVAVGSGVSREQLLVDPGPDFSKTPAQTVEVMRALERLHELQCPLLLACSRKDFVGAITGRPPRDRLAGTLAAVGWGLRCGAHLFRVHDAAATLDYLRVAAVLGGGADLDRETSLSDELRWERGIKP